MVFSYFGGFRIFDHFEYYVVIFYHFRGFMGYFANFMFLNIFQRCKVILEVFKDFFCQFGHCSGILIVFRDYKE